MQRWKAVEITFDSFINTQCKWHRKTQTLRNRQESETQMFKKCKIVACTYKANKKSWMTSMLFRDYLFGLNSKMNAAKRKIVLLIDNCPAHNDVPELSHVRVLFSPPNCTSLLQPLDQ